jgi:hypothetical protein
MTCLGMDGWRAAVLVQRGVALQTSRTILGSRQAGSRGAGLIDVATRLGKGTLAVKCAALASNKLPTVALRHAARAEGTIRFAAAVRRDFCKDG